MAEAGSLMEQGIALARAGRREEAYATLRRVLFTEGDDATLRIWLGGVAPTMQEAYTHLERAVELGPDNAQAQAGLQWIAQQLAAAPPPPPPPADAPSTGLRRLSPTPSAAPPVPSRSTPDSAPAAPEPPSAPGPLAPRPNEPYIPQQLAPRLAARPLDAGAGDQMPAAAGGACPNCGMPASPNDRFCLRCGRPLAAPIAFPLDLAEASLAAEAAEGTPQPWGVRSGEAGAIEPTIAPLRSRSLQARPLDEDAAPHPLQGPPADSAGPPLERPAFAPGAASRPAPAGRPWLIGALIALLVLVILGSVAVYAFTIRPQQESAADATATVEAASAGATATVIATVTQAAEAQATARREATLVAIPTTTAQAVSDQYLQHISTIIQQVESQDADIQHTLQGLQDGLLDLSIVEKQFGTFVDQSSDVKNQLAMLYVPGNNRRQHQALTDALTARGQAIVSAQQFVEDLIWLAQVQYQATQAQQDLTTAQDLCTQTKVRADCTTAYTAQQKSDSAKNLVDRVQTYVAQSLQEYTRTWAQYKQLMPAPTTGDTHQ